MLIPNVEQRPAFPTDKELQMLTKDNLTVAAFLRHDNLIRSDKGIRDGIAVLKSKRYYGPYLVFCSEESYEARRDALFAVKGVQAVYPSKLLQGTGCLLFQLTPDVIKIQDGKPLIRMDRDGNLAAVLCAA